MKRDVKKITEAILAGADIRKSISEDWDTSANNFKVAAQKVKNISFKETLNGYTYSSGDIQWADDLDDYEEEYELRALRGNYDLTDSERNSKDAYDWAEDYLKELKKNGLEGTWEDEDGSSIIFYISVPGNEDIGESLEESQNLDPEEKDIARAEKLKGQNSRFALKQACSIQDKAKMIRRMKAVGKICGLDSEQYDAFKYAAKGFLSPDEVAEIEVFVKAA